MDNIITGASIGKSISDRIYYRCLACTVCTCDLDRSAVKLGLGDAEKVLYFYLGSLHFSYPPLQFNSFNGLNVLSLALNVYAHKDFGAIDPRKE